MADRVECPVCTKDVPLLKSGVLRNHRNHGDPCPASGLTPAAAVDQMRAEANDHPSPAEHAPVELVDRAAPSTDLVHTTETASAIEAAAAAALLMPGVPGQAEFLTLAMTAKMLSMSGAAPKLVKGDPHLAFHIALVGRDLGISPSAALELIDVLDTAQGPRLSLSPQLMNGQLRRLGLGSIRPIKRTMYEAIAGAYDPEGLLLGESEFTWEDAVIAGLADKRCEPNAHWTPNSGQGKCSCRPGYRSWPKRMLWWRAAGFAGDDYFPEAGLGLYSPEALGAVVDEHGRPIDPTTVTLPDGYDPGGNGATKGLPPADDRADGEELWRLQARIQALPTVQKATLAQQWKNQERLQAGQGKVIPAHQLPENALRLVKSLVSGLEGQAERTADGWQRHLAADEVLAHCASVLVERMLWPHPLAAQIAQDDPPAPTDPDQPAGPPAATQQPIRGQEPEIPQAIWDQVHALSIDDLEAELGALGRDITGRSPQEMRSMLALAEAAAVAARQEAGGGE